MSKEGIDLELFVRYRGIEAKFTGKPDDVVRSFLSFVGRVLPTYELVSDLTLTVDLEELLRGVKGLITLTPEGPVVTVPKEKLGGEREIIILHLIKTHVGCKVARLEKDSQTTNEIIALTGGKPKTVGARLSELTSLGWVERVGRGEYRITTLGVNAFLNEVLPRIKPEGTSK